MEGGGKLLGMMQHVFLERPVVKLVTYAIERLEDQRPRLDLGG